MTRKFQKEHSHFAALELRWAADARRDQRYNRIRSAVERRAGNLVLSRGYAKEAAWDEFWWRRRMGIVEKERRLAGRK